MFFAGFAGEKTLQRPVTPHLAKRVRLAVLSQKPKKPSGFPEGFFGE